MKYVGYAVLILTLVGGLWTGGTYVADKLAWSADLKTEVEARKALERTVNLKFESDYQKASQERLWQLEKLYPVAVNRPEVIDHQIKELEQDIRARDLKIRAMGAGK
jgi:hypothetical protein